MTAKQPRSAECLLLDLTALRPERDALLAVLDADERARALRLRSATERERFVLRRGALRRLLAERVGADAASLELRVGDAGKPFLVGSDLRFSASSSGGLFAVALAHGVEVGLDVERLRALPDADVVADPFLTSRDRARLGALPASMRPEAFLRLFTLREALAKWEGLGIGGGRGGPELPLEALASDGEWTVPTDGDRCFHLHSRRIGPFALLALATAESVRVRWEIARGIAIGDERPVVAPTPSG